MKKNLNLSFNHSAHYTQQSVLLNGEPILSPDHAPSFEKFSKNAKFVLGLLNSDFNVDKLARELAKSDEDGMELAISAVTCGDLLTEISPEYRAQGTLLLMAHILGNQPISELVDQTQTTGMRFKVDDPNVDHDEMYVIATLSALIVFGMIMATESKALPYK